MKRFITYHIFLFAVLALNAQDVVIEAEYPSVVEAGQQLSLSWTVNAGGGQFSAPSFEGFYKLMGPQTSYSSSTQFINGKVTQQTTNSYTYYLQSLEPGSFVIPPASYTVKNKTWYSDSIRIEVVGSGAVQQNAQPGANPGAGTRTRPESSDSEIYVDFVLNRREVYIGEHITATVKIYTRVDLSGINEIKYPSFTGFLKSDIETPPLTQLKQENVNGTNYGTGVIQNFLLYPQLTGEITIDPVQISVLVRQKSAETDPFFSDFFSTFQTVQRAVISPVVKVDVKPLPGTKPSGFSGVVGKIELKATLSKDSVNVNDAVNFKVSISGNGNLKLAEAPRLTLSPDIEVYDPKVSDNIKNTLAGTSGSRTFDYILIPRHYGDFKIPAVTYSFFNTASGKYETLSTDEYSFYARRGTETASGLTVYGTVTGEDVRYVGKDIRFIKPNTGKLSRPADLIITKRTFYSIYAIALFVFLLVLFLRREHIRRNADITAVRNRKAGRMAGRRLREASVCLKKGEMDRFHEEILKAVWGYLSDKLNISAAELNRSSVITVLKEKGVSENDISSLTGILDNCEYARYSPSASGTEALAIYDSATGFIRSVENSIVR
ncbi:MAG: BatD family protein [Bacteroidota bacterium]